MTAHKHLFSNVFWAFIAEKTFPPESQQFNKKDHFCHFETIPKQFLSHIREVNCQQMCKCLSPQLPGAPGHLEELCSAQRPVASGVSAVAAGLGCGSVRISSLFI